MTPRVEDISLKTPSGKLFVRTWGDVSARPPFLLFHDSLGCVETWRDFPARLAAETGRGVVAYDRLGYGRSDPHPEELKPDFIRSEVRTSVAALKERLGFDKLIPFGHSIGGAMAVVTGAEFPQVALAVVTEAAQAFIEDMTIAGIRTAEAAFRAPGQMERLTRYHGDKAEWVLNAWTSTWFSPDFRAWTLDDDLRRLSCPVLAMHGDRDEYGSRRHPERIGKLPPGDNDIVIFDDCGHIPHREKPELVLQTTGDFIRTRLS